ncbi:MAG: hypothetical protein ACYDH6_14875 [Acidimicrobiales bacterium]
MRRLLQLASHHRLRATLTTGGIALGVLAVALAGGVLSGKLEHRTSYHGTGSLPPVASSTTTSTVAPAVVAIKADLVEDMSLDVESQRLEADPNRRAALAQRPAAVTARHTAIATAWAPDKAAAVQTLYDRLVAANARNPRAPSVLHAAFVATSWTDVIVEGDLATAVLEGHYQLTETTSVVSQPDQQWTIHLRMTNGRWQLEDRSAI